MLASNTIVGAFDDPLTASLNACATGEKLAAASSEHTMPITNFDGDDIERLPSREQTGGDRLASVLPTQVDNDSSASTESQSLSSRRSKTGTVRATVCGHVGHGLASTTERGMRR